MKLTAAAGALGGNDNSLVAQPVDSSSERLTHALRGVSSHYRLAPTGACASRVQVYGVEQTRSAGWLPSAGVLAVALTVSAPWLVPASLPAMRLFAGLLGWLAVTKAAELARNLPRDPQTRANTGAFILWLAMPRPTTWPIHATERARFRAEGVQRAMRGLLKAACLVGLIALSVSWPGLHTRLWLHSPWGLCICYLVFSGGMDLVTSIPMLFGVHVAENFDSPFLAATPSELWGRRWNFWFHDFVRREVFLPLRRSPRRAVLATFAVSGLAHEYLIVAALGRSSGQMLAFFMLQGLGVLLSHRRAGKLPRKLAWAMHMGWLILTLPLFLQPILQIAPLDKLGMFQR